MPWPRRKHWRRHWRTEACRSAPRWLPSWAYFSDEAGLREFLAACQIGHHLLSMESALDAARIMRWYARNKGPRERVAPDFLIGAHARQQADALLTTDAGFYRQYFDGLRVVTP